MHYFASKYSEKTSIIPSTTIDNLDPFRTQPDFDSYGKYLKGGFLMIHKFIYDYILKKKQIILMLK